MPVKLILLKNIAKNFRNVIHKYFFISRGIPQSGPFFDCAFPPNSFDSAIFKLIRL